MRFTLLEIMIGLVEGFGEFFEDLWVLFKILFLFLTMPIWIIPYLIYKKRNDKS